MADPIPCSVIGMRRLGSSAARITEPWCMDTPHALPACQQGDRIGCRRTPLQFTAVVIGERLENVQDAYGLPA